MIQQSSILIVDDEPTNVDLLSRYVSRAGHKVSSALGGAEAIDCAIEQKPDLVLLDWMMPELSGIDVLRALRERYSINEMPIIMCTALDEADHVVTALSEGANDYVSKPVNPVILKARMAAQLDRRRSVIEQAELNERLEMLVADRTRALARMSEAALTDTHLPPEDIRALLDIMSAAATGDMAKLQSLREPAARLLSVFSPSTELGDRGVAS